MILHDDKGQVHFGKFDLVVKALIVLSLVAFAFETLPDLSPRLQKGLHLFELIIVAIFTLEYIVRVACSRERWRYVFSFYGIVDLLAILPFYLALGVDLRSLRAFRLLRLFRIFKLFRYSAAMRRLHRAFDLIKEEIVLFGVTSFIVIYISATGIYYFESQKQPETFSSVFHCLWWAVTTLTTVGYGDAFPVTVGGKCFTILVLIVGLGIVAVPAGLFASALAKVRHDEEHSDRK